jgi:hypothetical protein
MCRPERRLPIPRLSSARRLWQASCPQIRWLGVLFLRSGRLSPWQPALCRGQHHAPELQRSIQPTFDLPDHSGPALRACSCRRPKVICSSAFLKGCRSGLSSIGATFPRRGLGLESLIYACSQALSYPESNFGSRSISDRRSRATATKAGSISIAKQRLLVFSAAQRCVPEPENGS